MSKKLTCKEYLREAVQILKDHCLFQSSTWISEILCSINESQISYQFDSFLSNNQIINSFDDQYELAKNYFQNGEFSRASYIISQIPEEKWTPKHLFLWGYSVYMDGERQLQEDRFSQLEDPTKNTKKQNVFLDIIEQKIIKYSYIKSDPFLMYLLGMIYKKTERNSDAIYAYITSVNIYPCLWSAWYDMGSLVHSIKDLNLYITSISTTTFIKDLFYIYVLNLLQNNDIIFTIINSLSPSFQNSIFLLTQQAIAYYNNKEYDQACDRFKQVLKLDPFHIDDMDIYSNILYIQGNKKDLSLLAHRIEQTDKYRPETCVIIGNYYSLNEKHEQALVYFQRAVKLDSSYYEAWTLMGHEYVELKQSHAAIVAYKTAVDYNSHDYKALYGLGVVHELLQVYTFSLYYYKQALNISPTDSRILCGIASCYYHLNNIQQAIACYTQADTNKDIQGIAALRLGEIYESQKNIKQAAYYYQKYILKLGRDKSSPEAGKALLFLTRYYTQNKDMKSAFEYGDILLSVSSDQKIVEEVHQILNSYK